MVAQEGLLEPCGQARVTGHESTRICFGILAFPGLVMNGATIERWRSRAGPVLVLMAALNEHKWLVGTSSHNRGSGGNGIRLCCG